MIVYWLDLCVKSSQRYACIDFGEQIFSTFLHGTFWTDFQTGIIMIVTWVINNSQTPCEPCALEFTNSQWLTMNIAKTIKNAIVYQKKLNSKMLLQSFRLKPKFWSS